MTVVIESIRIQSPDPNRSAAFWSAMTGRPWTAGVDGARVDGNSTQVPLQFEAGSLPEQQMLHLHLCEGLHDQQGWIDAGIAAGGKLLGSGVIPMGKWARMSDPVGDGYCVIEDGNRYLEGCGPLGEVTCDGSSTVGRFWSTALDWPIVWDQHEEIAIQSPLGGTKLAWSGTAPSPAQQAAGRYVNLVAEGDVAAEIRRLVSLGAASPRKTGAAWMLSDPDGIDFVVR